MKIWNEIKKSKGLAEREKALLFPNLINNGDKTESKSVLYGIFIFKYWDCMILIMIILLYLFLILIEL